MEQKMHALIDKLKPLFAEKTLPPEKQRELNEEFLEALNDSGFKLKGKDSESGLRLFMHDHYKEPIYVPQEQDLKESDRVLLYEIDGSL